jgi:hypothetical protein
MKKEIEGFYLDKIMFTLFPKKTFVLQLLLKNNKYETMCQHISTDIYDRIGGTTMIIRSIITTNRHNSYADPFYCSNGSNLTYRYSDHAS